MLNISIYESCVIGDSLIGERAQLKPAPQRPKALRFMIGDDSKIEL